MSASSPLLDLPRELRDTIWQLIFANLDLAPFAAEAPMRKHDDEECLACQNAPPKPLLYHDAFLPLLTCKKIYEEASPVLQTTGNLHFTTQKTLAKVRGAPTKLCCETKALTIYLHLDEDNREDWMTNLNFLTTTFPHLASLTIHNHMRPPLGYDALIDAIHLAGPIVKLPAPLSEKTTIHFAYISEYVMFENAFLGVVRVSDALQEHEGVVRDLLRDPDFKDASEKGESHLMTNCLLRIAREHEQPWFARLQRRRWEQLRRSSEG